MKTDLYTKIILTVIAVALTVIVLRDFHVIPTANAASPQGIRQVTDVNVVSFNGQKVYMDSYGALYVNVRNDLKTEVSMPFNSPLKVEVVNTPTVDIKTGWQGLDVNVKNYSDFK